MRHVSKHTAQLTRRTLGHWGFLPRRAVGHRGHRAERYHTFFQPASPPPLPHPSSSSPSGRSLWVNAPSRLIKAPSSHPSDGSQDPAGNSQCYHTALSARFPLELIQLPDHLQRAVTGHNHLSSLAASVPASGRPSFQLAHAACGIPKNAQKVPLAPLDDLFSFGCGEDAYFCRHDSLGVADGVGGWEGVKNANPAMFSRKLMHYAFAEVDKYECIEDYEFVHYYDINPVDILRKSYTQTLEDAYMEGIRGSSTACLAILRDDELRVANLGDCGLLVIRQGAVAFRTEEQQHSFNFPFQIGTGCADRPEDAQVFTVKVRRGDIIVLASDGIFDNLFEEDILDEVHRHLPAAMLTPPVPDIASSATDTAASTSFSLLRDSLSRSWESLRGGSTPPVASLDAATVPLVTSPLPAPESLENSGNLKRRLDPLLHINPARISDALARRAKSVSEESRFTSSPFQTKAIQEGFYHQGGKADDITVLVAVVTDLEDSPDRR
ncbi:hypothetical protein H4R34_005132 [Dimargaris verticillata]|uniref:Protein phosphatase n=1 Tax=Dimargaris verticillata TaxID=2761393 RepID=A0A9W8B2X9_9FUNG|nr:hypothetical protein H4R34_005132 [Dimargaris verticillata]